jgi:hypothetical protein
MRKRQVFPSFTLALAGAVCGGGGEPGRFQTLREAVLLPRCAGRGCHDAVGHKGNLTFEGETAYDLLVRPGADGGIGPVPVDNLVANHAGWVRVLPGEPDRSFLVRKLEGPGPGEGEPMPRNAPPLEQYERELVRRWIEDGAPR